MRLPDFIVAGARKCGTTWLHRHLASDASIFLPPVKELYFFDRYWDRGVDWYANYFSSCPRESLCGEITPSYFTHPGAAERIKKVIPSVKLVFMFRNPMERALSLYGHMVAKGDTRVSFKDALGSHPDLIDEGLYFKHLRRFEEQLGQGSCHVLILEDIAQDGERRLRDLYGFLGVSNGNLALNNQKAYERRVPRSHVLAKSSAMISRTLHHLGLHGVVRGIKALGAERIVYSGRRETASDGSREAVRSLRNLFRDDVEALSEHLGRDLSKVWGINDGGDR